MSFANPTEHVRPLKFAFGLVLIATGTLLAAQTTVSTPVDGTHAELAVLETTDLHFNALSYDYFKLGEDKSLGFERAATLIRQARKEFENTLLFDDGDTIQGTSIADWQALASPLPCDRELGIYKAMDSLVYDAGTIGNHEFNYGLAFLSQVTGTPFNISGIEKKKCKSAQFPFVLSNVFSAKDGKSLFEPWRILVRTIHAHAADGSTHDVSLRIGVLGFAPPLIMDWDKRNLDGKVSVLGEVEAARKYIPELQKAGVDLIVALSHGGIDASAYSPTMENAGLYLAQVPGIDAILLGHSHDVFPNPNDPKSRFAHIADVDNVRGSVRGVPAVMGNYYGKAIGLIDLALLYHDGHWQIDRGATHSEVRSIKTGNDAYVAADTDIETLLKTEHAATVAYVKTPIGHSDFAMNTYFVAAGDTSALQIVNMAQRDYVQKYIKSTLPQYADVPVLSAASPFKAGFGGVHDYTDVPAGALAIHNAADLYLYPNTVTAVKMTGAGVKAWLEQSAGWFNRIDPSLKEPQELLNSKFQTYNFDVLQGDLTYAIDVTKPREQRIVDLRFHGEPLRDEQSFIVVTNNYRGSGGGHFPGLDGGNIVISAPDTNRDTLINFIRAHHEITRKQFGSDHNWRFVPVKTAGPVVFTSAANKLELARAGGLHNVTLWKDNGDGSAIYSVGLSQ